VLAVVIAGCGAKPSAKVETTGAFGACRPSKEAEPTFPIDKPTKETLIGDEEFLRKLTGWRSAEEHRTISAEAGTTRTAELLTGGRGGFQALYVDPDSLRGAWHEFLSKDPEWSQRSAADPTWATHTEPSAFEPQYQFSYFASLSLPTQMSVAASRRVFEGTVMSGTTRLAMYCVDRPLAIMFHDRKAEERKLRFVVDPSGYVTEFVHAAQGTASAECKEITLSISPDLDVIGMRDDPPSEWMTMLKTLPSCRGAFETRAAELQASGVSASPVTTTRPSLPVDTAPSSSVARTAWHDDINRRCTDLVESAKNGDPDSVARELTTNLKAWSTNAPSDIERDALDAALAALSALASDDPDFDPDAMEGAGHQLEQAGLDVCGSMFLSG
jgi:hypothetical protein